ncbi:GGDEF domain-containing protein [Agaribacterium sp. ZY112]|uniref:sensor domain-containing diguanylate cyclase n=1 Tax=Agaribacterium sp. ZY112 TaxID=3233574 RepID=UPI003524872C
MASANNVKDRYKEKYLHALGEQERLEKQLSFQTELLKKTLLKLASAASGMDAQLDSSVLRLRELMRGGTGSQAAEQLEVVQQSVHAFELARAQETTKAASAMQLLLAQFQNLQVPTDLKASLSSFSKALEQRLSNYRQYAPALEELAKLQALALEAASNEELGLWQRIKGGRSINLQPSQDSSSDQGSSSNKSQDHSALGQEVEAGLQPKPDGSTAVEKNSEPEHLNRTLAADEDSYEEVATRINHTLANLVDNIEPNANIRHRIDIVRHRIKRGMDWFVLAATLEDIRDILMLRYLQADDEFGLYLNQIKQELGGIGEVLASALESEKLRHGEQAEFAEQVQLGVDRMRNSVASDQGLDRLKHEVTEQLGLIHTALNRWQAQPHNQLEQQLQQLAEQVEHFKKESEASKKALEQQRHKATHDTLTGLANREAYAERAFQEWQRFGRDGLPLTVAVCDIDHFKKVNDNYGHQAGDKVLKLIASLISKRLRATDFIARYGGEEFVLLLTNTASEPAFTLLDKIRKLVASTALKFKGEPMQISISIGIAELSRDEAIDKAFERADAALYKAKNDGRNRCEVAEPDASKSGGE